MKLKSLFCIAACLGLTTMVASASPKVSCPLTTSMSALTGDLGGNPFPDECPAGQVMIGFETGSSSGFYGDTFGQFATLCGIVQPVSTGIDTWDLAITPGARIPETGGRGTSSDMPIVTTTCPTDQFVVAVDGQGIRPVKMALHCAPITARGQAGMCLQPTIGTVTTLPAIGYGSADPFGPLSCPAGSVATGSNMRAGEVVNQYGLFCKSVNMVLSEL